jgi:uncharacterized membrane protein YdjX (TVP38/TMEM64 family)
MDMNGRIKILLLTLWSGAVLGAAYAYLASDLSIQTIAQILHQRMVQWGSPAPLVFIAIYALRSLVFFPGSLLAVIAGLVFGPLWGFAYTLIGENLSANISFLVGRYFGADLLRRIAVHGRTLSWIKCKLQQNGMMAVITMRLMFLPFDLVGYSCGLCNIRQRDFALGSLVGTLPGLVMFVLLGGAIEQTGYLFAAMAIAVVMVVLAKFLNHREALEAMPHDHGKVQAME